MRQYESSTSVERYRKNDVIVLSAYGRAWANPHDRGQTIFRGFRKASRREPFAAASFSYGVFSHLRGERIGDEFGGAPASELDIIMH